MKPLTYDDTTETSLHTHVIEASDCDYTRKGWPVEIPTSMGNGMPFQRCTKKVDADGDIIHVRYRQVAGCLTLIVYND